MSEIAMIEKLRSLHETVAQLQERVECLEDLRDLEEAILQNDRQPLLPWKIVKKDLALD